MADAQERDRGVPRPTMGASPAHTRLVRLKASRADADEAVMTTAATVELGWYPDPHVPGVLRYFDGERWTQHTLAAPDPTPDVPLPTQGSISAAYFWATSGIAPA